MAEHSVFFAVRLGSYQDSNLLRKKCLLYGVCYIPLSGNNTVLIDFEAPDPMSVFPRISEVSRDDNSLGTVSRGGDKAKGCIKYMPMEADDNSASPLLGIS
jgi:hypothetical protein